ncbi:hypothetical protein PTKU46_74940 [Paraburkholderia terrae]|uniref:hypothetical protein n=1 Tax=Paraburkholderia terrae TaxID=311230 RepID=UPI0030E074DC
MKERAELDITRQIAAIRSLQLDRSRNEGQRLAKAFDEAKALEIAASDELSARLDAMRCMIASSDGFSPALVANWDAEIASGRVALTRATERAQASARDIDLHRAAFAQDHRRAELADELTHRASRSYRRACDEQRTDMIEGLFRACGEQQ